MIDPTDITQFDRTDDELEEFWLFSLMVAGKNAKTTATALARFLAPSATLGHGEVSPLSWCRALKQAGALRAALEHARVGKYALLERAITESLGVDLRRAFVHQLEEIHGVGPKTARYFVLHTRPNQHVAVLDTHILAWLRELGYDAPKQTPTGPRYAALELAFLAECAKRQVAPAVLDLAIWNQRSKNGRKAA